MDSKSFLLLLMVLSILILVVAGTSVLHWAREKYKARQALILNLAKDHLFIEEIERLGLAGIGEQEYSAEISLLQRLILEQLQGLNAANAKLLREPLTQASFDGRTGYIEDIARDVRQTYAHVAG